MQRVVLKWEESEDNKEASTSQWTLEEELVTGVVVGVLGRETEKGEFLVRDVCFAGPPPLHEDEENMEEEEEEERSARCLQLPVMLSVNCL